MKSFNKSMTLEMISIDIFAEIFPDRSTIEMIPINTITTEMVHLKNYNSCLP